VLEKLDTSKKARLENEEKLKHKNNTNVKKVKREAQER